MNEHRVELEGTPSRALEAVEEATELWGGDWQQSGTGGRLILPVSAGIRHGHVVGQVSTQRRGEASEIALQIERTHYELHWPSLVVLLIGAAGGILIVVAPFFPPLFPLVPAGILVSLAAWFLVVSRVRTRGSIEFLELVSELVAGVPPPE